MKLTTGGAGDSSSEAMDLMGLMKDELMQLLLEEVDDIDLLETIDVEMQSMSAEGFVSTTSTIATSTVGADSSMTAAKATKSSDANGKAKTKSQTTSKPRKRRRDQQFQLVQEVQELEKRVQDLLRKRHHRQQQLQPKKNGLAQVMDKGSTVMQQEKDVPDIYLGTGLGMQIRPCANAAKDRFSIASKQQQHAHHRMTNAAYNLQELLFNADTESHLQATRSDSNHIKRRLVEDFHQPSKAINKSLLECFDEQTRVQWLLERLSFSFQQMDLVMHQYLMGSNTLNIESTDWIMPLNGDPSLWPLGFPFYEETMNIPSACPLLLPRRHYSILDHTIRMARPEHEYKVVIHDDFAEMSGTLVTPFDLPTTMDSVWKCFSVQTRGYDDCATGQHSITDDCLNSVLHGTVQFTAFLGRLAKNVHIQLHGALQRTTNEIVWENVGRMSPVDEPVTKDLQQGSIVLAQTDFTESAWTRVASLPHGGTMVHHVHRIAPVMKPTPDNSIQPCLRDDKEFCRQQVQVLAEFMDIGREDAMKLLEELIQNRLAFMQYRPSSCI